MRNLFLSALAALFVSQGFSQAPIKDFKLKVRIEGLQDTSILIAYHYGDKKYVKDTIQCDAKGYAVYEPKEPIEGGIYLIATPEMDYFELLVSEPRVHVETKLEDLSGELKVLESKENKLFYEYQRSLADKGKRISKLREELKELDKDADKEKKKALNQELREAEKDINTFRISLAEENKGTFLSKIIQTMREPEIPEPKPRKDGKDIDSAAYQFYYYKNHYFDYIDLGDNRLLRTPILNGKVMGYLNNYTFQNPDSITMEAIKILDKAYDGDSEVFKYFLTKIASKYERDKRMGMDAVFVYLGQRYYLTGKADWLDEEQKKKVRERIIKLSGNIVGKKAVDLVMKDDKGVYRTLYEQPGKFTVVYFWDSGCGHCKKVTPKMYEVFEQYKDKGLSVYAVNIEAKKKEWLKYINEKKLTNWVNVADTAHSTNFRVYYDIYSTPVIYMLDEEKKILAKRIDVDQVKDILAIEIDGVPEEEILKRREEREKEKEAEGEHDEHDGHEHGDKGGSSDKNKG